MSRGIIKAMGLGGCLLLAVVLSWGLAPAKPPADIKAQGSYTGSQSCRECHERFYQLWAPSHHGTAMQAYSDAFAAANLTPQKAPMKIRGASYQAQIGKGQGWVVEKTAQGQKRLAIKHALGGKNIYYFLTPMDKGRLQTLPVAYDINKKAWFDTAKSGIRHASDQPVDWRDAAYTFNTSCHGCHVSQFSLNYNPQTGAYHTTWKEPGINCETCHGPGEAHAKVCREAPKGTVPKDLKISRGGRDFTHDQNNATCSTCHAKAIPLTQSFMPGDNFWDHFDLALLEHSDYYPDGRDLGENYTYTSWLMSPCNQAGKLDCTHCHTSSGRFRQKKDPNRACLPCHAERVANATAHTRHKADSPGNQCIACHMPMTSFAGMHRSDHSMLPPTPAATIKFKSPNACNHCHKDKDAAWADAEVRAWHKDDYQAPVLHRAGLIQEARDRDWSRLPGMLAYISGKERDPVFAASLIRLLGACPLDSKWPVILKASADPSPLVRGAALAALGDWPSPQAREVLLAALKDPRRLVRIRAAQSLARYPRQGLSPEQAAALKAATQEMLASFMARPDTWSAFYNVGNYYLERGVPLKAIHAYQEALGLSPDTVIPRVNLAMAHARAGDAKQAARQLRKALELEPNNATANFNLGLLLAEQGDAQAAEKHLRAALKADPKMAPAAYNLGLLLFKKKPGEALPLCRRAYGLSPNPRYGFTLAYMMGQEGDARGAAELLQSVTKRWPAYADAYLLWADILRQAGETPAALQVLQGALGQQGMAPRDRLRLHNMAVKLGQADK
ncbi:MAG: tetratricopeptide repeat protein [Desulfarculaceae bacterium]|nr:tetratricopeptide repeat protein [Desulfarculaceae bacterium]MCF8071512.1 tetratricopeptide repeat protein [Desulfarculaceae bacterium]MCF8102327.1 tetratricopeptide repeat protein [Desulfarculaceae bacterium]MCF8114791.1 tetratricopeptide repeat protein [Desulfarculaceae bacterium]